MKRIFLFIAIIFASFHVFAQESLVKVSPFHFIDGTFNLSYEIHLVACPYLGFIPVYMEMASILCNNTSDIMIIGM